MAITTTERTKLIELFVLMFDAAPGASFLSAITDVFEATGHSFQQTANVLGSTLAYQTLHPNFEQPDEFAYKLLSEVGLQDNETVMSIIESLVPVQTKATITYLLFNALLNVPANAPQAYLDAQATLLNKGEVAEYYSVTIGGRATDYATLNDIIAHVDSTDASVIAAEQEIDQMVATGPELTPGVDNLHIQGTTPTVITGVVDGNNGGDDNSAGSTFNGGDSIEGNGHTYLDLVVVDGGDGGFERLTNIEIVNITAGTDEDVRFNAGLWNQVDEVSLNQGVDGMGVFLDNLKAITDIEVKNVKGDIAASYDTDNGNLFAHIYNSDEGGDGIRLGITDDAGVAITGADDVFAFLSRGDDGDAVILPGGITAHEGNDSGLAINLSGSTADIGDINATFGTSAGFFISGEDVAGDIAIGDIDVVMSDSGYVSITFGEDSGDVSLGNLTVHAGDDSFVMLAAGDDSYGEDITGDFTIGDVDMQVGASGEDFVFVENVDGNVTFSGDVTLVAGDSSSVSLTFEDIGEDVNVDGTISVTVGEDSEVTISAESVEGDITVHDISVGAGIDSTVSMTFDHNDSGGEDIVGSVSIGNVEVNAGSGSHVGLAVYSFTHETVGDIDLTVEGGGGNIDVSFSHALSDVSVGNVNLQGGEGSRVEMTVYDVGGDQTNEYGRFHGDGTTTIGDITGVGEDVHVGLFNSGYGYGDVTVGNVELTGSGAATFTMYDHAHNTAGDISVIGGSDADIYIEAEGEDMFTYTTDGESTTVTVDAVLGSIHVGDINASITGTSASNDLNVTLHNVGANVLDVVAGDVSLHNAADDSGAYFEISNTATESTSESNTGTAAGGVTVGNITVEAGSATSLESTVEASVSIENNGEFGDAGDVVIGDVSVTVGDGFASGTVTNEAQAILNVFNYGEDGVGNLTVGNVDMHGGDFADVTVHVSEWEDGDPGTTGRVTVGDVSVDAGESAHEVVQIYNYASGEDSGTTSGDVNGGISVGDIDMSADQDSYANVSIAAWNQNLAFLGEDITTDLAGQSMGDVTVGDIHVKMGDNSTADLNVYQFGNYSSNTSITDRSDGDLTVGNISVSVSATTDQDLSGGSFIDINVTKTASSLSGFDAGSFTVGDVMASAAGAHANISISINFWGTADTLGDVNVGQVGMTAGDDVDQAYADVYVANYEDGGDIGDVTMGGAVIHIGDDGNATYSATIAKTTDTGTGTLSFSGDVGNVAFGNFDLAAGDGSAVSVNLHLNLEDSSSVGDLTIGDVVVDAGKSSTVDFASQSFTAGEMGDVGVGDVTITAAEGAGVAVSVDFVASTGDVGEVNFGDVNIEAGTGAAITYSMEVTASGDVGDVTIGDWDVVAGTSADIHQLVVSVSSSGGDVGHVDAGNVTIDAGQFAMVASLTGVTDYAGIWVNAAGGDAHGLTAGDVDITAHDGAEVNFTYQLEASDSAGNLTIGDVTLIARDEDATATTTTTSTTISGTVTTTFTNTYTYDVGDGIAFYATLSGDANDVLTIGDLTINVEGSGTYASGELSDEVQVYLNNVNGDVVIGDVRVSGAGTFILDGAAHTATSETNTSFLAVEAGGNITIGNVDFTGYENDISLDLSWTQHGAANITGGNGDDTILGNAGDNIITGGEGVDGITITQGGHDTIVTNAGDTGDNDSTASDEIDSITGFDPGTVSSGALTGSTYDLLDFNLVAGTAGNFVIGDTTYGDATDLADFIANANDALNSTVKYFAETTTGGTWVAVNYGSGEADAIVFLVGVDADNLHYQNFVA